MKILSIGYNYNTNTQIIKKENNGRQKVIPSYNALQSFDSYNYASQILFGKTKKQQIPLNVLKKRVAELEKRDIETNFAAQIASLPDKQYGRANQLLNMYVKPECIADLTELKDENYKQALILAEKGIFDFHIQTIASFDEINFQRALDLMQKGIDSDSINLLISLSPTEFTEAEKLLKEGYAPIIAGHFCKLNEDERNFAQIFINAEADVEVATQIAQCDEKKKKKCSELLNKGINPEFILEIANLDTKQSQKLDELLALKVDSSSIAELAQLEEADYKKAIEMLQNSVNDDYINFIIEIENGTVENEEYSEYRKHNYSRTTAFSLSLLSNNEIEALTKIRAKHPIIYQLLEDEYEITIADIQNDDTAEAIFTKQIRTPEGTKITLVRTFDEYGEETKSRTEEYKDNSVSSILSGRSGTFKTKYDKFGEIKEMTEFIQDNETGEVTGVIHSKASSLLAGVFESTYYDISQFKEGYENQAVDTDIEDAVLSEGEPISKVVKNNDGSITYTEKIELNNINTDRIYTEKRDNNGQIIFSSYKYKIQEEDQEKPMMDISRTWEKIDENTTVNKINSVSYKLTFDDENKTIKISDGEHEKLIEAKEKLPYYSSNIIWNEIKKLHADTILTIFDKITQWNYCLDSDSVANAYMKTLSTGTNNSIIYHETGHLITNCEPSILDNEDFVETYGREMETFQFNLPYNEQEYVQYFSPRAGIVGSDGADEFVAETNILLTTYGTTNYKIKTRTQFLEKYFPKTIAKVAELTGKNSTESLLK